MVKAAPSIWPQRSVRGGTSHWHSNNCQLATLELDPILFIHILPTASTVAMLVLGTTRQLPTPSSTLGITRPPG